jgi:hypothetical protein
VLFGARKLTIAGTMSNVIVIAKMEANSKIKMGKRPTERNLSHHHESEMFGDQWTRLEEASRCKAK